MRCISKIILTSDYCIALKYGCACLWTVPGPVWWGCNLRTQGQLPVHMDKALLHHDIKCKRISNGQLLQILSKDLLAFSLRLFMLPLMQSMLQEKNTAHSAELQGNTPRCAGLTCIRGSA